MVSPRTTWVSFIAAALVAGCSTQGLDEGDDEALERVAIDVKRDELTLPPLGGGLAGSCSGTMPACGCGGVRLCAFGSWGPCIYPPEKCNGIDDDCDGLVDEGGDALCTDNVACTTNEKCTTLSFTLPTGQTVSNTLCMAGLNHARCNDNITCTTDRCSPTSNEQDDAGCTHAPVDSVCSDGCSCSGQETCSPGQAGANAVTGCRAGRAPCERDGNVCTINACCEGLTAACRATLGANAAQVEAACAFATGDRVVADTGSTVTCPAQSTALPCDDGNPCTREIGCSATSGCLRQNVADNTVLASLDQGCALDVCIGGQPARRYVRAEDARLRGLPTPSCGSRDGLCTGRSCQPTVGGALACLPNAPLCDDGAFCNGTESCSSADLPPLTRADGQRTPRGCVRTPAPCRAPDSCTFASCNETTNACWYTHNPAPECSLD